MSFYIKWDDFTGDIDEVYGHEHFFSDNEDGFTVTCPDGNNDGIPDCFANQISIGITRSQEGAHA